MRQLYHVNRDDNTCAVFAFVVLGSMPIGYCNHRVRWYDALNRVSWNLLKTALDRKSKFDRVKEGNNAHLKPNFQKKIF